MRLSVAARLKLFNTLTDAYQGFASFALVLDLMGKNVEDLTTGGTREQKIMEVIKEAEARNFVEDLISAVHSHQSGNSPTQAALEELLKEIEEGAGVASTGIKQGSLFVKAYTDDSDEKLGEALQREVRRGQPDAEVLVFSKRLDRVTGAVCSIEWSGEHQGTGFLIGSRTLITNRHVIAAMEGEPVEELSARFGFARGEGQIIHNGKRVPFGADWKIASRPHDLTDTIDGPDDAPEPENLDYAIVRLAHAPEGVIPVSLTDLGKVAKGNDVVLIQHPSGAPKKISFGRITAIAGENRRLRYDANTKPGSSGSPVIDHNGELIGLHHAGDPNFDQMAKYNQAIPLHLIAADLDAKNVEVI